MKLTTEGKHPFGERLAQYRARKPGLTQTRLAELTGYDQAILIRMAQGKKDLTGPSGRERILRLVETLADQGALMMLEEANDLLMAAGLPPLYERQAAEARLITRLARPPAQHRTRRTNLPAALTTFVGRAPEIADLRALLGQTRLLTLTGAGGTGKTRLAQRIAADVLLNYRDGVWYAELASLRDPALIPMTVANIFGLAKSDRPSFEQLSDFLRERQVLLVLDNCEHLIDGAADFAKRLLTECALLKILTTSREALNIDGEMTWRVPPMRPDEASTLFVERAHLAQPSRSLGAGDATVSHICQRLDGMPLAIELAAARLNAISLSDIAARLDDRFALLSGGRRGALARHQTLRALIDWSHDLLSEREKALFRRLSVFVGGWTLEEAEVVAGYGDALAAPLLSVMNQLVSKSLVNLDEPSGASRYYFLETVRDYAADQLKDCNEVAATRRRHATAFLTLAERSSEPLRGQDQMEWLRRIERDYDNFRAALAWSFDEAGDVLLGCQLVAGLTSFWFISTRYLTEVREWILKARAIPVSDITPLAAGGVRASVIINNHLLSFKDWVSAAREGLLHYASIGDPWGIAVTKYSLGAGLLALNPNDEEGLRATLECRALCQETGNAWLEGHALHVLGIHAQDHHDMAQAEVFHRGMVDIRRGLGNTSELSIGLWQLAGVLTRTLRFAEALPCLQESARLAREVDSPQDILHAECDLGNVLRYLGDLDSAVNLLDACVALARDKLFDSDRVHPLVSLGRALADRGEYGRAHVLISEAAQIARSLNWQVHTRSSVAYLDALDSFALLKAVSGKASVSARLWGASDFLWSANYGSRPAICDWEFAPYIARVRAAIGDEAFEAAFAEGRTMPLDAAIAYALKL